jgi:isopenicillin N synthase-like dioxygenase
LTGADAKDTFESIPVINVEGMFSDSLEERKKVAAEVGKASREVGFFYAQNHSVTEDTVTETFKAVERFFALPVEDKMEVHIHKSNVVRGYEPVFETKMDPNSKGGKSRLHFSPDA